MNKLFKIATWNVNSIRIRLSHVLEWLAVQKPDVLALQETKVEDKDFPKQALQDAGYNHVFFNGQKTYNGVALVSRTPMHNFITVLPDFDDIQRRFLIASIGPFRVVNIYVPNGGSVDSDKYSYKLHWLDKLHTYLRQELLQHPRLIVLGDFNIAPEDKDVHDPSAWEGHVLVSPPERQKLKEIMALGLKDSFRLFNEESGQYSWWDYRAGAYRRNHGLRIDHILSSTALTTTCINCEIDTKIRGWARPSDHVPVIASYQHVS
ncbi:MAG: exodeoxyribonuclease III [Rickettsiella sp.]|nr:exodeoxyribonuclease III [Rickettsiella sp.]